MNKIIIFLILVLLCTNPIYADENTTDEWTIYPSIDPHRVYAITYNTTSDLNSVTTVEQTNTTKNNTLQENTTIANNNSFIENNTKSPNSDVQYSNHVSNNNSVENSMYNTANPLFVLLIACILIPMGIYRKRK